MGALDTRVGNVHKGEQIPPQNLMLFGQMLDLILLTSLFLYIYFSLFKDNLPPELVRWNYSSTL